jgi:hypothetical protein
MRNSAPSSSPQDVEQSVRALPYVAHPLLEFREHELAAQLFPNGR